MAHFRRARRLNSTILPPGIFFFLGIVFTHPTHTWKCKEAEKSPSRAQSDIKVILI
jgi:hypothetical protein